MASIVNRSRTEVKVKEGDGLTKLFPHTKARAAQRYVVELRAAGHKPTVNILDEAYLVRFWVNGKRKSFTAKDEIEAAAIKKRIESEQHYGLFVDYTIAHQTTFADLLVRYLRNEAPRQKGFLVVAYKINKWLQDAGLPREDIAAIHTAHPNPEDRHLRIPRPTGRRMSQPSESVAFIRKTFSSLEPEDFHEYIDEQLQTAEPGTVDRELDVFRSVCSTAIEQWRIHVHMNPMSGLKRPKYFNERDRRLRGDEEAKLMQAAHQEDQRYSVRLIADELFSQKPSGTKYQRLQAFKEAKHAMVKTEMHVPILATFIQFQLMTGARRGEALQLKWDNVDLKQQTAFLPETKNGRSRTLPVRSDLVTLLGEIPNGGKYVFPIPPDYLRKAWKRICTAAGIATEGDDRLRIHDLRHEAISRVAEAGSQTPGGFSMLDLQAFSGHRDPRMLMRYSHLTPTGLARRLDAAFSDEKQHTSHHGQKRLSKTSTITIAEVFATPLCRTPAVPQSSETPAGNVVHMAAYRKTAA